MRSTPSSPPPHSASFSEPCVTLSLAPFLHLDMLTCREPCVRWMHLGEGIELTMIEISSVFSGVKLNIEQRGRAALLLSQNQSGKASVIRAHFLNLNTSLPNFTLYSDTNKGRRKVEGQHRVMPDRMYSGGI